MTFLGPEKRVFDMKNKNGIYFVLLLISVLGMKEAFAANANENASYKLELSCSGSSGSTAYYADFYQGYGYGAGVVLKTVNHGQVSVLQKKATGGSFTECGSRTIPCTLITSTQYNVNNPSMIFTMFQNAGSNVGKGTLRFYGKGFDQGETLKVALTCTTY
jgi:hypothetical protein